MAAGLKPVGFKAEAGKTALRLTEPSDLPKPAACTQVLTCSPLQTRQAESARRQLFEKPPVFRRRVV